MNGQESPKVTIKRWLPRHDRAVALVAADDLSDERIAADVGIVKRVLERWKHDPRFRAEVAAQRERIREAVLSQGIADRVQRVRALDARWQAMNAVIAARKEANRRRALREDTDDITFSEYHDAGADGGLMTHTVLNLKGGGTREFWDVDVALLKEIREHEKQAAQEVGQWIDKPSTVIDARTQNLVLGSHLDDAARAAIIMRALGGPTREQAA